MFEDDRDSLRFKLEREEVEKLKWIESEKAGYDIGYYRAWWLWNMLYRSNWIIVMKLKQTSGF